MSIRKTILSTVVASFAFAGAVRADTIPERLMEDLQEDFGFADFQAAGVVGNLARETGNFRYLQEINPIVEGSRGGIGYSQWTGKRRRAFEAWADGQDLNSYEANYGFLVEELSGAYARVVTKVLETETAAEAADVFMRRFLIPHPSYRHLDERIAYAEAYLEGDFSGAGCQATHEVETSGRMIIVSMCPEPAEPAYTGLSAAFAQADIEELLPTGLDEDVEIVLAEILTRDMPLRSERLSFHHDEVPDSFVQASYPYSYPERTEVTAVASVEKSPKEVIYGLLELD